MENIENNPLIAESPCRFEAVPFDLIRNEHFVPALEYGIREAKKNIAGIKDESGQPDFEKVIVALESCSEIVDHVTTVYFNLFGAEADSELQALAATISPMASALSSDILLDDRLFEKVKAVYNDREKHDFSEEQLQLIDNTYKGFVRNGALLDTEKKNRLREIDQELSVLSPKFAENVLKSTNIWGPTTAANTAFIAMNIMMAFSSSKTKTNWPAFRNPLSPPPNTRPGRNIPTKPNPAGSSLSMPPVMFRS